MGACHPLFAFDGEHRVPHAHFKEDLKDTNSFLTSSVHYCSRARSPEISETGIHKCGQVSDVLHAGSSHIGDDSVLFRMRRGNTHVLGRTHTSPAFSRTQSIPAAPPDRFSN